MFAEDPKIDSTTMFAAALISKKNIDSILDEDFPWGEGVSELDTKKQEEKQHIKEKVISYLALMTFYGVCFQSSEENMFF